jgi:hypothetical protein
MNRRQLFTLVGAAGGSLIARRLGAAPSPEYSHDYFMFIHAAGGWDVMLWADPRNERKGLVEPPSLANTDIGGLERWKTVGDSFEPMISSTSQRFGPAIGALYDLRDRLTIINGIAMNTVSHDDGTAFSTTGRHRIGGSVPESSVDVVIANELGRAQLMPDVAVKFPSSFVGTKLDRRSVPLRLDAVDAVAQSFSRSRSFLSGSDRAAVTAVLTAEAKDLVGVSRSPVFDQLTSQHQDVASLVRGDVAQAFTSRQLRQAYPEYNYRGRLVDAPVAAAFAVEAIKRNAVRCVGFSLGGLDTHTANHRQHALILQELFAVIATTVKLLDKAPHPTLRNTKLSERTHILVVSEFCRTPHINPAGGRDHYPNNSALIISPRFRGGRTFGATDPEQLLPVRDSLAPPDLLATYLHAFGIDPRRFMRDGRIVKELLAA